jgi:Mg2+ and Co2+ transporter CorA
LKKILNNVEKLNKDIILFGNRMMFDEVTPQEQGIDLYDIALKNLDIENQYNSLRIKVSQLYDFIRIHLEHGKTDNIHKLTIISIVFAVVVCILTFWAIDFSFLKYWKGYPSEFEGYSMIRSLGMFVSSSVVLISVALLIFNKRNYLSLKKEIKNFTLALLIVILILSLSIFAILFFE